LAVCDGRNVVCNYYVVHYQQLEVKMSWVARKQAGSDWEDQQQVINEYFEHKEKERENEIKKFWEEYEDEYFAGGS
jgi:thiamine kinase-like enzyme